MVYDLEDFDAEIYDEKEHIDELYGHEEHDGDDTEDRLEDLNMENEEIDVNNVEKPYVGMKFESDDDAYVFYNRKGFEKKDTRKMQLKKKRRRGETRVGCGARIYVNKTDEGMWTVSLFEEDHNHKCETPKKCHLFTSHRRVDGNQGAMIEKMNEAGIRKNLMMHYFSEEAQGRRNVGFTERDMRNYLRCKRAKTFEKGDAQCLLDYLNEKQLENPHFFYAIQLDAEAQMTNFFWVDAKARMDYSYFGDVVCFDTTYGTNAYAKPFIPIVGVNNHLQTTLFGCALMLDETVTSFQWVLQTWMKVMKGFHPKLIFTDQDAAMAAAIANILPNTCHRFCLWHIFQNVKKHLSHLFRRGSLFSQAIL
ncbi:protein FAR1-RELATED SEQUENCE 5-like [Actinidia eriantha]|uniref:protein FAR1-RELATED SEQUENCE 5-like n=1 Tax=Actinidia eriantha TaxID=165200 RepID=UPI002585C086|nr:protein FAR1-RELATED SEQUENCE 5-like [Actinidia eriantha]